MASARSVTSVKPANFALGRSARIASCTNAFTTRIAAADVGPSAPPALRKASPSASVQASAAALAAAYAALPAVGLEAPAALISR